MINKSKVRLELGFTEEVITDAEIDYIIAKIAIDDINLVCAEALRLLLRKHRGVVERRIGKFYEIIRPGDMRTQINSYMNRAATTVYDDNEEFPDKVFTEDGI